MQDLSPQERVQATADLIGAGDINAVTAYELGDDRGDQFIANALIQGFAVDFFPPREGGYTMEVLLPMIDASRREWLSCNDPINACRIGDMYKHMAEYLIRGGPSNDAP